MRIKVSQLHINKSLNGVAEDRFSCPIDFAVAETLDVFVSDVATTPSGIFVTYAHADLEFLLPDNALRFVTEFDALKPVEPIEFDLIPKRLADD